MKSFKQKTEEKRKQLAANRLIVEENIRLLKEEQEWQQWEQEQQSQKLQEQQERADQLLEENAKINAEQLHIKNVSRMQELKEQEDKLRIAKTNHATEIVNIKSKKTQKVTLKEILSGEYDKRQQLIEERNASEAVENYRFETKKDKERLQLIEEKERLQLEEISKIESNQLAEQEKLEKWEREEQEWLAEEARIQQEAKQADEAEMQRRLDIAAKKESKEIDWIAYEAHQQQLAEADQEQRIRINKVLNEVQQIHDSERQDVQQKRISHIHDYLYKLNPDTIDPWVNRPQPKLVLTWEEWKSVSVNELLFEEDGRRARLLFEQDNARSQRYYQQLRMYSETSMLAKSVDRVKSTAELNKEAFDVISNKRIHLSARNAGRMFTHKLREIPLDHSNLSVCWGNIINGSQGRNDGVNVSDISPSGAKLYAETSASVIDGNPDTYWRIYHNSQSVADGPYEVINPNVKFWDCEMSININFDAPQVIKRIELYAVTRSSMPLQISMNAHSMEWKPDSFQQTYWKSVMYHNVGEMTGSDVSVQNNDVFPIGEQYRSGSSYGFDLNGSASLDPLRYNTLSSTSSIQALRINFGNWATGSHVDIHQIKLYTSDTEVPVEDGDPIYKWQSSLDSTSPEISYEKPSLSDKHNYVPDSAPTWHSGSDHKSISYLKHGLDPNGKVLHFGTHYKGIPYVQFHRFGACNLVSKTQYHDYGSFTHFIIPRFEQNFGVNQVPYSDRGSVPNEKYFMRFGGHVGTMHTLITDAGGAEDDIHHTVESAGQGARFSSGSWPWSGPASQSAYMASMHPLKTNLEGESISHYQATAHEAGYLNRRHRNEWGTRARIICTRFDTDQNTAHTMSQWIDGGPEFRNDTKTGPADYVTSGSQYSQPTLGGLWANHGNHVGAINHARETGMWPGLGMSQGAQMELHEHIIFDKALTIDEINTVYTYLEEKWSLPIDTPYEISGSINGVVQSNQGYRLIQGHTKFRGVSTSADLPLEDWYRPKVALFDYTSEP